jgi:hypothetical protein
MFADILMTWAITTFSPRTHWDRSCCSHVSSGTQTQNTCATNITQEAINRTNEVLRNSLIHEPGIDMRMMVHNIESRDVLVENA